MVAGLRLTIPNIYIDFLPSLKEPAHQRVGPLFHCIFNCAFIVPISCDYLPQLTTIARRVIFDKNKI